MNELSSSWTEAEKQLYLMALEYVLNLDSDDNPTKREFMKNKAVSWAVRSPSSKRFALLPN